MTVKGVGTIVYFDADGDDQYVELSCIKTGKLPGAARGVVEEDACLEDTAITQDSGDLKRSTFTFDMLWDVNETVANSLETAQENDDEVKFAVKIPKATPEYVFMVGKIVSIEPSAIERTTKLARSIEFLPTALPTKSTTAPTLEP